MTIRRKRRQRGKRKELRREALKTWAILTQTKQPPRQFDSLANFASVMMPQIRNIMPTTIASTLVGVQPMTMPMGMIGNAASGVEKPWVVRVVEHESTKKEISEQRKAERKNKKRKRANVAKALRAKRKPVKCDD